MAGAQWVSRWPSIRSRQGFIRPHDQGNYTCRPHSAQRRPLTRAAPMKKWPCLLQSAPTMQIPLVCRLGPALTMHTPLVWTKNPMSTHSWYGRMLWQPGVPGMLVAQT